MTSPEEFLQAFATDKLYTWFDDSEMSDLDAAMACYYNYYGKDFIPDINEIGYSVQKGHMITGEEMAPCFALHKKAKLEKDLFLDKYNLYLKYSKTINEGWIVFKIS